MALTVISSYPRRGSTHGQGTVGVASYAKNTVDAIAEPETLILAEEIPDEVLDYTERAIRVIRCWKRNRLLSYCKLYRAIKKHSKTKTILVESELVMFGNALVSGLSPLFFLFLRLKGYRLHLVIHQVVLDANSVSGHLGLREKGLSTSLLNGLLRLYYLFEGLSATKIIVFDQVLKERLRKVVKNSKIVVIPHGVETDLEEISKEEARKLLGIEGDSFVGVAFGFLAWYKGSDWVAERFADLSKKQQNWKLLLAGGPNPNHQNKPHYKEFTARVLKIAKESNGVVVVSGFVPEEKIPLYYAAANIVIFPYRTLMSSSGPLSLAFSFKKPFLLSEPLKDYLRTADIATSLKELGITEDNLCFDLTAESFSRKLEGIQATRDKIISLSGKIRSLRSWERIGHLYRKELGLHEEAN